MTPQEILGEPLYLAVTVLVWVVAVGLALGVVVGLVQRWRDW